MSQDLMIETFRAFMHFQQLSFITTLPTLSVMQNIPQETKFKTQKSYNISDNSSRASNTKYPHISVSLPLIEAFGVKDAQRRQGF